MASHIARIASLPCLLLLANAAAWAGRGDIDPNYGEGGQFSAGSGTVLSLQDSRLLIDVTDSADAFKVRVVDARGRDDPNFGNGGYALITTPPATPQFLPDAVALGPDGEVYVAGTLWAQGQANFFEALLRLNARGQPDLSFGGQGDGFFRLSDNAIEYTPDRVTTVAAFTVDAAGRLVVAQHGWTAENACGGPMLLRRLLANAEPDPEFGNGGTVELLDIDLCDGPQMFAAREDGSILVGDRNTIIAIATTGGVDSEFAANGRLHSSTWWYAGFLLPNEDLLLFNYFNAGTNGYHHPLATQVFLTKFDRSGQVDSAVAGVKMEIKIDQPGMSGLRGSIGRPMLAPDATQLFAQTIVFQQLNDGLPLYCRGIARFSVDGILDDQFGRHGLTCLSHGSFNFSLLSVQGEGAPLVQLHGSQSILRLLPDDMPSPGLVTVVRTLGGPGTPGYPAVYDVATESSKEIVHSFIRTAGHDGAVSIDFSTGPYDIDPLSYYSYGVRSASAVDDYVTTSGRLDWANGEDGERTATVKIIDDGGNEPLEVFGLMASDLEGGALLISAGTGLGIMDDDAASPPSDGGNSAPPPPSSGGGGSVSWVTPFALLTLLLIRRRRDWQAAAC
jgi:hypothetical protein